VSRMLVFEGFRGDPPRFCECTDPPKEIVDYVRRWIEFNPAAGNMSDFSPSPAKIPVTPDAGQLLNDFVLQCHEETLSEDEESGASIWARCPEKAAKLALIRACSERFESPEIDVPEVRWAIDLVSFLTSRLLFQADRYLAANQTERDLNRVKRMIEDAGPDGLTQSVITSRTRGLSTRERNDILETLVTSEEVIRETQSTATRPALVYRIAP